MEFSIDPKEFHRQVLENNSPRAAMQVVLPKVEELPKTKPCYCDGKPLEQKKMKLDDISGIQVIDGPQLSRLSTFDTRHLEYKGDLSHFGELDFDESLNARDHGPKTASYLR